MEMATAPQPYWDEAKRARTFVVGVDLGQVHDYTAICVLERFVQPVREINPTTGDQKTEVRYEIRYLERPALGTSYPTIVSRVAALVRSSDLKQWRREKAPDGHYHVPALITPSLVVDGTGPGRPVVDEFGKAGLQPIGVSITNGDHVSRDGLYWRVPKRNLVSQLRIAFQNRVLKIAQSLPLASTLATELQNFKVKINLTTAHDSYSAWRENEHDDLVLSASLALWWSQEQHRHTGGMRPLSGF